MVVKVEANSCRRNPISSVQLWVNSIEHDYITLTTETFFIHLPRLLSFSFLHSHGFFHTFAPSIPPSLSTPQISLICWDLHLLSYWFDFRVLLLFLWQKQKLCVSSPTTQGCRPHSTVEPQPLCRWTPAWVQPHIIELKDGWSMGLKSDAASILSSQRVQKVGQSHPINYCLEGTVITYLLPKVFHVFSRKTLLLLNVQYSRHKKPSLLSNCIGSKSVFLLHSLQTVLLWTKFSSNWTTSRSHFWALN